jgi:hypothetical protein
MGCRGEWLGDKSRGKLLSKGLRKIAHFLKLVFGPAVKMPAKLLGSQTGIRPIFQNFLEFQTRLTDKRIGDGCHIERIPSDSTCGFVLSFPL